MLPQRHRVSISQRHTIFDASRCGLVMTARAVALLTSRILLRCLLPHAYIHTLASRSYSWRARGNANHCEIRPRDPRPVRHCFSLRFLPRFSASLLAMDGHCKLGYFTARLLRVLTFDRVPSPPYCARRAR